MRAQVRDFKLSLALGAYGVLNRSCREADVEGTPFGRYRLIELLGRGGMGEVWRSCHGGNNRTVAIKRLPPHLAQDDTFVQRPPPRILTAARHDGGAPTICVIAARIVWRPSGSVIRRRDSSVR